MSRIQTNIPAMNTLRQLGNSSKAFARSLGRLSSGFRINRAADDAAGLGIANTLRADIRATRQASRNTEQGTSVLQIIEGGAQQLSGILERMKELAAQAGSDSVNATARVSINREFDVLSQEVDRIVNTTKFQGQRLMDGTFGSSSVSVSQVDGNAANAVDRATGFAVTVTDQPQVNALTVGNETLSFAQDATTATGAISNTTATVISNAANAQSLVGGNFSVNFDAAADTVTLSNGAGFSEAIDVSGNTTGADIVFATAGITLTGDGATNFFTEASNIAMGTIAVGQSFTATLTDAGAGASTATLVADGNAQTLSFANHGLDISISSAQANLSVTASLGANDQVSFASTTVTRSQFLVSASGDYTTNDLVELDSITLSAAALGVDAASIDLTTGGGAQAALSQIDVAITKLNDTFSRIGAAQNRLDFAFNNAQSTIENLSAAESVIRDTDIAAEVTMMTKFQILQQAGTAVLAQANSAPQGVLALLR